MKKIISLLLILVLLPCLPCFAFKNEGIYDMAYSFDENGYARVVLHEKWGIIDTEGKSILECEYDYISELKDGFIRIKKDGLYGFMDSNFSVSIPPCFLDAKDFSEGFACVKNPNGKWGYINDKGDNVCDFLYDDAYPFADGLARVILDGKTSYIDKSGNIKINPSDYRSYDFSCGFACVNIDGKFSYMDKEGNIKIDAVYDLAWDFCENLAAVKTGDVWSFIDTEGNVAISGNFDRATSFSNGLAPVRTTGGKYGLINSGGKLIIPHKYDYIGEFYDNFAFFRVDEKYGYINSSGLTVIPMLYDRADDFSEGYALVGIGEKTGYIDKSGKFIAEPVYLDGGKYSHGYANVKFENGLWGYTDFSKSAEPEEDNQASFSPDIISGEASVIKLKIGNPEIFVNGEIKTLATAPKLANGRTLLPIRAVVEAAGGTISWDHLTKKVTISYDGSSIILEIGSNVAKVNGILIPIDVAPEITDGSTMVPLRFVAERLNMGIKWNGETNEVTLYY